MGFAVPASNDRKHSKVDALAEDGTLNPAAEKGRDPKFRESGFFDPRDLVQVKYEMLRRVSIENAPLTDATEEYGVSRPTYYQTKANFDKARRRWVGTPKARSTRSPQTSGRGI